MTNQETLKYSVRGCAATSLRLPDFETSLQMQCPLVTDDAMRKNQNESRDHDQVKEDLIPEGSDKLRLERAYVPKLNDELDSSPILFEDEEEDSDDDPTVISLPDVTLAESIPLDEELTLNQNNDLRIQVECAKTEDWHRNHMAAVSSEKFDSLLKMCPDVQGCKSHMAAFVLMREGFDTAGSPCELYKVVAVGAGRLSSSKWLCYNGTMIHDCHAIIVARRALKRFLYKQLLLFFDPDTKAKENCIFESSTDSHLLQLKPKISLHLYTNHSPEGATKNFYSKGSLDNTWTPMTLLYHANGQLEPVASLEPSIWGAKVCCMSASDKMCLWTITGVQGSLLSNFIEPLYITSVVLGGQTLYNEGVSDTVNKRLGDDWEDSLPTSYRKQNIIFLCSDLVRPIVTYPQHNDLSINWCLGDEDIEVVNSTEGFIADGSPSVSGPGFSSRLCKRALYSYFRQVAQLGGHSYLLDLPTYQSIKLEAIVYQTVKDLVKEHFLRINAGPWNSKMLVDCFST